MKYYVTTKKIMETIESDKATAKRIFQQAKAKSKYQLNVREVPASIVNEIIGYKAFAEPQLLDEKNPLLNPNLALFKRKEENK